MGDGGVTDGVEIGVAHGNRQGAVLGEIEVLARERRKNRRQRLGQHNPTQPKPFPKSKAAKGLPLAPWHSVDATAHDLCNRRTREHREPHKNRTKFNAEVQAQQLNALIRKPDQPTDRHRRKAKEGNEIPEQQLQEQRNLTNQGHVAPGQAAQQTVVATAGCTGSHTQAGGQHQASRDHLEAVQPTDGQGPEVAIGWGIGESCFRQSKTSGSAQPAKTQSQARSNQVDRQIVDQQSQKAQQYGGDTNLNQETTLPHQVNGGEIIKPPSPASRFAPRGIATALSGPRWRL